MIGPTVLLAGASGDLGGRLARALVERGADVRALVRDGTADAARTRLSGLGATVVSADPDDTDAVAARCEGAACVVSALSGLREVILDRQTVLLDAAVRAGVPRFISSDYAADYTRTVPGHNRNLDLRREFTGRADRAPIRVTSILCGAFMDMLGAEMPIIASRIRRILYWGDADQPLDFTTREDTAAYTAAAALDDGSPRVLRIVGNSVSARDLAAVMSRISGERYRPLWVGTVAMLGALVPLARRAAPEKPTAVFPAWQGMQYMVDMFSGDARLHPLDNDRYPGLTWTSVEERLRAHRPDRG